MRNKQTRVTIIIILLVVSVVGYYAYLSNKSHAKKVESNMTAVEAALSRDLQKDYPPTPKEVMKYYNEMLKCLYYEEISDDEVDKVGMKMRELYDSDLLAANETGSYLIKLASDVKDYRDANRRITSTSVPASTNVDFYERDGYSFARLLCTYNVNEKGTSDTMRVVYLLRKEASTKRWKIFGWDYAENVDLNGDGVAGD